MKKLNEKILHALKSGKETEKIFRMLLKAQENLLKNHSNPVFNKVDTNKILKAHTSLDDVGKSLYRYNTLQEHHLDSQAQEEKQNIENNVLKTGISNNKYIWHSENGKKTCEVCASLDGKEFDFYDEVPERPHPNCRCYVEIVDNKEKCDVIDEIEAGIYEMELELQEMNSVVTDIEIDIQDLEKDLLRVQNLIKDTDISLEFLSEEYGKHLPECEYNIDAEYVYIQAKKAEWQTLLHDILGLINPIGTFLNTIKIFISNYLELLYHAYHLKEFEMDKYYHSKANCEATQTMGIIGQKSAEILSDLKEQYDKYTYVRTHKVSLEEAIADSERDQVANRLGRERGRQYPYCNCAILMHDLLPGYKK